MARRYHPFANGDPSSRARSGSASFNARTTYEISRPAPAQHGYETGKNHGRKRIAVACSRCRKRKIKCSGDSGDGLGCDACKAINSGPCQFLRVSSQEVSGVFSDYSPPSAVVEGYPSQADMGMYGSGMTLGLGMPSYASARPSSHYAPAATYFTQASTVPDQYASPQSELPLDAYKYNASISGPGHSENSSHLPSSSMGGLYPGYPVRTDLEREGYKAYASNPPLLSPVTGLQSSFATMGDLAHNLPLPSSTSRMLPDPRGPPQGGINGPQDEHGILNTGFVVDGANLSHPPVLRSQGYSSLASHGGAELTLVPQADPANVGFSPDHNRYMTTADGSSNSSIASGKSDASTSSIGASNVGSHDNNGYHHLQQLQQQQHDLGSCRTAVLIKSGKHYNDNTITDIDMTRSPRVPLPDNGMASQPLPKPQAPTGFPSSCSENSHATPATVDAPGLSNGEHNRFNEGFDGNPSFVSHRLLA